MLENVQGYSTITGINGKWTDNVYDAKFSQQWRFIVISLWVSNTLQAALCHNQEDHSVEQVVKIYLMVGKYAATIISQISGV
jgi:hypothetical protein